MPPRRGPSATPWNGPGMPKIPGKRLAEGRISSRCAGSSRRRGGHPLAPARRPSPGLLRPVGPSLIRIFLQQSGSTRGLRSRRAHWIAAHIPHPETRRSLSVKSSAGAAYVQAPRRESRRTTIAYPGLNRHRPEPRPPTGGLGSAGPRPPCNGCNRALSQGASGLKSELPSRWKGHSVLRTDRPKHRIGRFHAAGAGQPLFETALELRRREKGRISVAVEVETLLWIPLLLNVEPINAQSSVRLASSGCNASSRRSDSQDMDFRRDLVHSSPHAEPWGFGRRLRNESFAPNSTYPARVSMPPLFAVASLAILVAGAFCADDEKVVPAFKPSSNAKLAYASADWQGLDRSRPARISQPGAAIPIALTISKSPPS